MDLMVAVAVVVAVAVAVAFHLLQIVAADLARPISPIQRTF